MKVFIGVDCNEKGLTIGFVSVQGVLKGLSCTSFNLVDRLGQTLNSIVRGLRGEENLRMKDFQAIGIGFSSSYVNSENYDGIKKQIKQFLDIPVYIDDRDKLADVGKNWLKDVSNMIDPRYNIQNIDLSVIYGATKLALDNASLNK